MRHQIEQSLGIKAYDVYGLTEITGPGVSYECSAQNGMHVCEDMFIPEIIDPDTEEVLPPGLANLFHNDYKRGYAYDALQNA